MARAQNSPHTACRSGSRHGPAAATSVSGLDVGALAQDAVSRGYLSSSCYLIDVEAGFELWRGGAGLATGSFSVNVAGAGSSLAPTPTATPASHLGASAFTG